jgi:hypothetical protein
MSTTITGIVTNGVIVPSSPLPEGANVEFIVVAPAKRAEPRGVPAAQIRGISAGVSLPPDDETVNRWLEERRMEK